MKKIVLSLVFAVALGDSVLQAQDTIWRKLAPLDNYFNNSWIDTTERYITSIVSHGSNTHINARQFFTRDTLQIYGIAAMMVNLDSLTFIPSSYYPTLQSYLNAAYPDYPSFEHCEESLVLFQYDENDSVPMQQRGEFLSVHMLHTPVSYYIKSITPVINLLDTVPKPVYERYFSVPQTVHDTFYAGFSTGEWEFSKLTGDLYRVRSPFWCIGVGYPDMRNLDEVVAYLNQDSIDAPVEWRFARDYIHDRYFLFPILTPEPDTTVNPGDTIVTPIDTVINPGDTLVVLPGDTLVIGGDTIVNTGDTIVIIPGEPFIIGGVTIVVNPGDSVIVIPGGTPGVGLRPNDLIYRYTSVAPNPARNSVRVTSSFGLSRLEAYDAHGRLIKECNIQHSALSINLDVSSWPRGTYLLRITTPAGLTTKKLLIQ